MTTLFLEIDRVRICEAEVWSALAGIMRLACANWEGSEVVRKALERVLHVMEEQARCDSGEKCGRE
jgi:hypothetical protein